MTADLAEEQGFNGVWLAERHFATPNRTGGVPSIASAPLILATAIASRTSRLRIGIGVLVLPLGHPIRMAEEVPQVKDQLSLGDAEPILDEGGPLAHREIGLTKDQAQKLIQGMI